MGNLALVCQIIIVIFHYTVTSLSLVSYSKFFRQYSPLPVWHHSIVSGQSTLIFILSPCSFPGLASCPIPDHPTALNYKLPQYFFHLRLGTWLYVYCVNICIQSISVLHGRCVNHENHCVVKTSSQ